jgi:predicted MFS family arabinose efflux permease
VEDDAGAGEATAGTERPIRNPLDPRNPLAGIYLATTLFELAESALRFLVPLNLNARGFGPETIGLVIFAFSLTSLVARGVTASVYRHDRARRLIVLAGLASTIAYLLTPFVREAWIFAALMCVDGFGWGVATTSLLAVMLAGTPRTIPSAVAMGWFVGFQGLANALATTIGGGLADLVSIQGAMLTLATVPVVAASLVSLRLPPPRDRLLTMTSAPEPDDDELPPVGRLRRVFAGGVRVVGSLPSAVWAAAVVALYLNVMNGLIQSFYPLLGLGLGLSIAQIGTLSSTRSAISSLARFGSGWLFARLRAERLTVPLLVLSAASVAVLPSLPEYALLVPAFALSGFSRGLLRVTTGAAAMDALDGASAGTAAAVMTAGLDAGKMVGPLIGGFVAAAFGLDVMFRAVPLAFLALYLGLFLAMRGGPSRTQ